MGGGGVPFQCRKVTYTVSGNLPDFCELFIQEVGGSRLFSPERGPRIVKKK